MFGVCVMYVVVYRYGGLCCMVWCILLCCMCLRSGVS